MQTPLIALWMPIIVSGVALFFASWAAWMVSPHHKAEWKGIANEDAVLRALREGSEYLARTIHVSARQDSRPMEDRRFQSEGEGWAEWHADRLGSAAEHGRQYAVHVVVLRDRELRDRLLGGTGVAARHGTK